MRILIFIIGIILLLPARATPLDQSAVDSFIAEMVRQHHFQESELISLFQDMQVSSSIISKISRPAEGKPWYKYGPIFLTVDRANAGANFWRRNRTALTRVAQQYGVAPEIIVAIIGVETFYGRHRGDYKVAESLATLAFHYPPRAAFFKGELEQFLLLAREQGVDPLSLVGSYAGAMGLPQFMPSSYRQFAADYDGDHFIDIWQNEADAIASVARYFKAHGWQPGQPVAVRAHVNGTRYKGFLYPKLVEPKDPLLQLRDAGVFAEPGLAGNPPTLLLSFEHEWGPEYWLALKNFYVITRYNHSPLYAMAVYQLSRMILERTEIGGHMSSYTHP